MGIACLEIHFFRILKAFFPLSSWSLFILVKFSPFTFFVSSDFVVEFLWLFLNPHHWNFRWYTLEFVSVCLLCCVLCPLFWENSCFSFFQLFGIPFYLMLDPRDSLNWSPGHCFSGIGDLKKILFSDISIRFFFLSPSLLGWWLFLKMWWSLVDGLF